MQLAPQELLTQYVQSQHFTSSVNIMAATKEMFRDVIQQLIEVAMNKELGRERFQRTTVESSCPNYRNGYSRKTSRPNWGRLTSGCPETGRATTSRKSDVEISPELVSKISEKIMPEVTAWQNRPLEPVYPFVLMNPIHYKIKEDPPYVTKAAYVWCWVSPWMAERISWACGWGRMRAANFG